MTTLTFIEKNTSLTDNEIEQRLEEVQSYDRFSVFRFTANLPEHRVLEMINADSIIITSKDGSTYVGYVEDWDDSYVYVNLR